MLPLSYHHWWKRFGTVPSQPRFCEGRPILRHANPVYSKHIKQAHRHLSHDEQGQQGFVSGEPPFIHATGQQRITGGMLAWIINRGIEVEYTLCKVRWQNPPPYEL